MTKPKKVGFYVKQLDGSWLYYIVTLGEGQYYMWFKSAVGAPKMKLVPAEAAGNKDFIAYAKPYPNCTGVTMTRRPLK